MHEVNDFENNQFIINNILKTFFIPKYHFFNFIKSNSLKINKAHSNSWLYSFICKSNFAENY